MSINEEFVEEFKRKFNLRIWSGDSVFSLILAEINRSNQTDYCNSVDLLNKYIFDELNAGTEFDYQYRAGLFLLGCSKLSLIDKPKPDQIENIFEPMKAANLISTYPKQDNLEAKDLIFGSEWMQLPSDYNEPFNSVWAWDALQQFKGHKSKKSERIIVPLIILGKGVLFTLFVDLLDYNTFGVHVFKDPKSMLFQRVQRDMLDSFDDATSYLISDLDLSEQPIVFRWHLEKMDRTPFDINYMGSNIGNISSIPLEKGASASAAFTLCAAKLINKI